MANDRLSYSMPPATPIARSADGKKVYVVGLGTLGVGEAWRATTTRDSLVWDLLPVREQQPGDMDLTLPVQGDPGS